MQAVYEAHGGLSLADARRVVDLIFDTVKARLARREKVLLSGFGSFRVVERKERIGVNPKTGRPMIIRGRLAVRFRPAGRLRSV